MRPLALCKTHLVTTTETHANEAMRKNCRFSKVCRGIAPLSGSSLAGFQDKKYFLLMMP